MKQLFFIKAFIVSFKKKITKKLSYRFQSTIKVQNNASISAPVFVEDTPLNAFSCALFNETKRASYLEILALTISNERPYLVKGYAIKDLSEDTGIPAHHLSCLINKEFNMNFQNFINYQRVEYVKTQIGQQEWRQLSLEGMAWEAGFTSRTTFFRAFIKNTGKAPSSYLSVFNDKID